MGETSIFGLDPDQLDELLSIGTDDINEADTKNQKSPPVDNVASVQKSDVPSPKGSFSVFVEQAGNWIGRYKLLSVLGEGGMGIVYLAEQEEPIRRRAALKVIKPGMDSKHVIMRFETERQTLALLDHPNIAEVHDAGTTEAGRPYFVMEYVKGLTITEHCDEHQFTIEERLLLFKQICDAVQYAHQKGIIHRDIKPSNILVSTEGDKAIPKIIDFGVAKAIAQPLAERTLVTEQGQLFGTPEYMSPEQADMANEDIDTRSDIYSLGVLLYVLLTGVLPFDFTSFREAGIEHIRKVIRETDPKTPNTRLTSLGDEAKKVAQNRQTEVATLARCLHKELEWIPLKAMRKDRLERYRSVSELADDIENYLKGEPLIAGPLSNMYRLKKFVRRNWALVTGIAAILAVLAGGIVVSMLFAIGQAHARAEAQLVTDFLKGDVLSSAGKIKGREATVRDVLDAASKNLEDKFEDKPLVEASIRETLRMTYFDLGDFMAAAQHQKRAHRIYAEQLGEKHQRTRVAMNLLAVTYFFEGRYREAESLYEQVIEATRREKLRILTNDLSLYKCNLACAYAGQGRYEEAKELLQRTLEADEWDRDFWPKSECMAQFGHHLADIFKEQGQYEKAEQVYLIALENKSIRFPARCTVRILNGLGRLYMIQGYYDKAEERFTKGIEIGNRELTGKGHPWTLRNVNGLAVLRTKQGDYSKADRLFNEALEGQELKLGRDHPETLQTVNDLGVLRREQKRYDEAESLLREALEARQYKLGQDHPACFESMHELAVLYKEQARYDEAEPFLLEAFNGRRLKLGDTHPYTLESWKILIELYEAWNKPEKALEWGAKLLQTKTTDE